MYDDHNLPIIELDLAYSVIIYNLALIEPSAYTTTSMTLSISHHGKLFEQETQKDVSLRLQLDCRVPWNRE